MGRRTTLRDVARAAGVGLATVSRALANAPRCSPETRERVRAAAERLRYVPDPALSALVSHRENSRRAAAAFNLAVISSGFPSEKEYLGRLWHSVGREARGLGYAVELVAAGRDTSPAVMGRMLEARGVRGIVWGWLLNERFLTEFPWPRFAHVGFSMPLVRPSITLVRDDSFRSVIDATEACFARGYRRPGLALMTSAGSLADRVQRAGWLLAHAEAGRRATPIWRSVDRDTMPLKQWVREQRIDVVIGNVDGVIWQLRADGVRVPGEVDFVNLLNPGKDYAGFDPREAQIARVLVNVLDRQIRHNDLGLQDSPHTILVRRHFLGWEGQPAITTKPRAEPREGEILEKPDAPAAEYHVETEAPAGPATPKHPPVRRVARPRAGR